MVQDRGFLPIREKVTDSSGVISRVWGESLRGPNLRASISAEYITEWINAKNPIYGAKGDGSTDDTTSLQAAVTAAANKSLYIPAGTYKYTSTITASSPIEVFGSGNATILNHCSATGTGISVTTLGKIIFKYLNFINTNATKTSDIALSIDGNVTQTMAPIIDHCTFGTRSGSGNRVDVRIVLAGQYQITYCEFLNSTYAAIYVDDVISSDSLIHGNFINTGVPVASSSGIFCAGCAGLKVSSNKILGYHYGLNLSLTGANQGPFMASCNSIENQATTSILILTSGSGSIGGMSFTGNEIGQAPNGIAINTSGATIANSVFSGNAIGGTTGYAVYLNGGDNILFSSNHIYRGDTSAFRKDSGTITRCALVNNHIDEDITTKYSGTFTGVTIIDMVNAVEFAELPTSPANGSIIYCADGTIASPVADSGSGCLAKRLDGAWVGN